VRCFSMHSYDEDPQARQQLTQRAVELFAAGKARPALFARLPLPEAREAHRLLESGEVLGKLVLKPGFPAGTKFA
jgi:NADPH2:quinone reductase